MNTLMNAVILMAVGFAALAPVRDANGVPSQASTEIKVERPDISPASSVTWLSFSPNGKHISSRYGNDKNCDTIELWSIPEGTSLSRVQATRFASPASVSMATCCFSADSSRLYYVDGEDILVHDASRPRMPPAAVARGLGRKTLPVQSLLQTGEMKAPFLAALVSAEGDVMLEYCSTKNDREKLPKPIHVSHDYGVAICPVYTSRILVFAVAHTEEDKYVVYSCDLTSAKLKLLALCETRTAVTSLAIGTDGNAVAVGDLRGNVAVYDLSTKKQLYLSRVSNAAIQDLHLAKKSSTIAIASSEIGGRDNLILLDYSTGKTVFSRCVAAKGVLRCALSASEDALAAFGSDSVISIWPVKSGVK